MDVRRVGPTEFAIEGLNPDEPVFVLRGQDAIALASLNMYRELAYNLFSDERMAQLEDDIDEWIEWRRSHTVRDPD